MRTRGRKIFTVLLFCFAQGTSGRAADSDAFAPVLRVLPKAEEKLRPERTEDIAPLLEVVSRPLLGRPYGNGPLGESKSGGKDTDPLYRLDVFDCTTFLETVLANVYCIRAGRQVNRCLEDRMAQIRYAEGKVGFDTRNHVPELDWLPNGVKAGFLKDVTKTLFPGKSREAKVTIDRGAWLAGQRPGPVADADAKSAITEIDYLPISYFFALPPIAPEALAAMEKAQGEATRETEKKIADAKTPAEKEELLLGKFRAEMEYLKQVLVPIDSRLAKLPSGSVLNLVRGNLDEKKAKLTPLIVHQGIILQKEDGAYFRHAAPNIDHVSEQRLSDYLIRYVKSPKARGITVYRILPFAR